MTTDDSVTEIEDDGVVQISDFPSSMPHHNTHRFISVIAGNSRFHWAMHDGHQADFFPFLFWKTAAFSIENPPKPADLARFLPQKAYDYLGGPEYNDKPTHKTMMDHLTKKKDPVIHIYMVITKQDARETIPQLFRDLPCRFIEMKPRDFVDGAYNGVGVDRCATLKAAMGLYGKPALVIDGGTATTWSSTDHEGNLVGGGITMGVGLKFNNLHSSIPALPRLTPATVLDRLKLCQKDQKPLAMMANNTADAIMGGIFREYATTLTSVVRHFVQSTNHHFAEHPPPPPEEGADSDTRSPYNTKCHVCVTGGDAAIFCDLLSEDHGFVLEEWEECGPDGKPPPLGASIAHHKNLASHAVGHVLKENYIPKDQTEDPVELVRIDIMGSRICNGEKRGTVYDFQRKSKEGLKDDLYKIKYDDGKDDFFNTVSLYDCLLQFAEKGEKSTFADLDSEERVYHKENSKAMAERFASLIEDLKESLETKRTADVTDDERSAKRAKPTSRDELRRIALGKGSASKKPVAADKDKELALTAKNISKEPNYWVGKRVAKFFEADLYYGTVTEFDGEFWKIQYDDGDREDYEETDMLHQLKEYELNMHTDPNAK